MTTALAPRRRRGDPPEWTLGALVIRRFRPEDFDTVLTLHREGLAQVGLRPGDGVYYEYDLFEMESRYLSNGGEFLVGELDRAVVAMGGLRRYHGGAAAGRIGEMVRLRVRPDVQRRGFGAALVLALQERARELEYRRLRADTTAFQVAALELYRAFGWRETHRRDIKGIVNVYLDKVLD